MSSIPLALIDEFGLDAVRYFLLREVPFGSDGDFATSAMIGRLNGELADTLGNLANRTLSLIQRNCDGQAARRGRAQRGGCGALRAAGCAAGGGGQVARRAAVPHRAGDDLAMRCGEANGYIDPRSSPGR